MKKLRNPHGNAYNAWMQELKAIKVEQFHYLPRDFLLNFTFSSKLCQKSFKKRIKKSE